MLCLSIQFAEKRENKEDIMKALKKSISVVIALLLLVSVITVVPVSANYGDTEHNYNIEDCVTSTSTKTFRFYMPDDWRNTYNDTYDGESLDSCSAGIYWWEGSDNCELEENQAREKKGWPGYNVTETDPDCADVFVAKVPDDVTTIIWTNTVLGPEKYEDDPDLYQAAMQTENIGSEYFMPREDPYGFYPDGTDDFDGMIYVCNPLDTTINEYNGKKTYKGCWFYYYGKGKYGVNKEPVAGEIYSNGEWPGDEPGSGDTEPEFTTDAVEELEDGYYLVGNFSGDNSWNTDIHPEFLFEAVENWDGYYILENVELSEGDSLKVVYVEDGEVTQWYPDGMGNDYIVDDDGEYNITFCPDFVYNDDYYCGHIYVENSDYEDDPWEEETTDPWEEDETTYPPATTAPPATTRATVAPTTTAPATIAPTTAYYDPWEEETTDPYDEDDEDYDDDEDEYDFSLNGIDYKISEYNEVMVYDYQYINSTLAVTIPESVYYNGVNYKVTKIDYSAFTGCKLSGVTIPDSVVLIDRRAFINCPNLTSVTIPKSVRMINDYAFNSFSMTDSDENDYYYYKTTPFTIYGYSGTEAERYAKTDSSFVFVDLTPTTAPPTTTAIETTKMPAYNSSPSPAKRAQVISAHNITKAYSKKGFSLGAGTSGNGKLSYSSNNSGVASVNQSGKVTLKGCGVAKITIKASATANYSAATKIITITVKPQKVKVKSVKKKGKAYRVNFKSQKSISGYEVKCTKKGGKTQKAKLKSSMNYVELKNMPKGKYTLKIRAFKKSGGKKLYGAWGKKSFTI
jgi:hypothetical protein